jgi:hypothetical protein
MKNSGLIKLSDDFWLKMPFDECSVAMGFEVEKLSGEAAL